MNFPGILGVGQAIYDLNSTDDDDAPIELYPTALIPVRAYPPSAPAVPKPSVYQLEAENKKLLAKLAAAQAYNNRMYAACRALGIEPEAINAKITELEAQ